MVWWQVLYIVSAVELLLMGFLIEAVQDCLPINDDMCSCKYEDTNEIITLWGIDDSNEIRFQDKPIKDSQKRFYYSPCTVFNLGYDEKVRCAEDIACVNDPGDSKKYYSAGRIREVETTKDGHVKYIYKGQKQEGIARTTEVTLKCDRNIDVLKMTEPVQVGNVFSFNLTTHCACANGCQLKKAGSGSNMSVGSILLTITFVLLVTYFIAGHLFLKYYRNLDGEEAIPNYDFWSELPVNIKEGFLFTKGQLCGGGEPGYDNI